MSILYARKRCRTPHPQTISLSTNEILRLVHIFTTYGGVNKIRLTGGGTLFEQVCGVILICMH